MTQPSHPHWLKTNHFVLLIFLNLLWGLNMLAAKIGVRQIPPILFSCLRVALMLLLTAPWLRWFPGQMRNLFWVALYIGAAGFGLISLGLGLSKDVSTVAIFTQLVVPFSTLLSVFMLGEVIHWRRKAGIALAFIGVLVIGFDPRALTYVAGLSCVVAQSLASALGMIYIKRLKNISPMQLQAWIAMLALPMLVVLSLVFEDHHLGVLQTSSFTAWGAVAMGAIGSSLIGQTGMFYLLQRYPVSTVAPLTVLTTLFGMLAGVLINHDVLTGRMLCGGVITLLGVLIIELRTKAIITNPAAT